jgi:hypothetical protein
MVENMDLSQIEDKNIRELVRGLLNLAERLSVDLRDA